MTHLLWIVIATCARLYDTETHSSPDANAKLRNAKNQNNATQSQMYVKIMAHPSMFIVVVVVCRTIVIVVWVIVIVIVVLISTCNNCYAVGNDDYSTKHG